MSKTFVKLENQKKINKSENEKINSIDEKKELLFSLSPLFNEEGKEFIQELDIKQSDNVDQSSNSNRDELFKTRLKSILIREQEILRKNNELKEIQSTFVNKAQEKQNVFEKIQEQIKRDQVNIAQRHKYQKSSKKEILTKLESIHENQMQLDLESIQ